MGSAKDSIKRGDLVIEGKTKKVFAVEGDNSVAIIAYKNAITAFDDPNFTQEFDTKAKHSNTTTCKVFEMLKKAGIAAAYERKLSDTEFLTANCQMIPLEVIARRYAVGSYLKRHPEFDRGEDEEPHRFETIVTEFFLKTTKGELKDADGRVLVEGLDPAEGEEDPFIVNPFDMEWQLLHPKKEEGDAVLNKSLKSSSVAAPEQMKEMERLVEEVFVVLENCWSALNFKFIDFKIEFGITPDGRLVVADVIDNDSWRLRDQDWRELSKQSFRDGDNLGTIKDKYALVAKILEDNA